MRPSRLPKPSRHRSPSPKPVAHLSPRKRRWRKLLPRKTCPCCLAAAASWPCCLAGVATRSISAETWEGRPRRLLHSPSLAMVRIRCLAVRAVKVSIRVAQARFRPISASLACHRSIRMKVSTPWLRPMSIWLTGVMPRRRRFSSTLSRLIQVVQVFISSCSRSTLSGKNLKQFETTATELYSLDGGQWSGLGESGFAW
jgi:hypothetical protein